MKSEKKVLAAKFSYKILKHRKTEHGFALRFRVRACGEVFDIRFPFFVKDWDGSKTSDSGHMAIINRWKYIADGVFARYTHKVPDNGEVKAILLESFKGVTQTRLEDHGDELLSVFDTFTSEAGRQNTWTDNTYQKFENLRRILAETSTAKYINDYDNESAQCFLDYLMNNGYENTTIAKYCSFLRWFFRWAFNHEYYTGIVHHSFRPKLKGVSVESRTIVYVNKDEIARFESFDFGEKQYLARVRDIFIFCCFCGLRYSDVKNLKRSNIYDGCINIVTQKTSDKLSIELNSHTRTIINRYADLSLPDDALLPVISNVNMNLYLKQAAKVAGLDRSIRLVSFRGKDRIESTERLCDIITTHCARRSFVVLALQLGIPIEVVMRWTGHSKYEAMKPYIAIVDELRKKSMSKFDEI